MEGLQHIKSKNYDTYIIGLNAMDMMKFGFRKREGF